MFDAVITGGLLSTGLIVIVNLAVADRFVSDTSTALRKDRRKYPSIIFSNVILNAKELLNHIIECL